MSQIHSGNPPEITVRPIGKDEFDGAKSVRYAVFCDEQGFSPDAELDCHDDFTDGTVHFAAYDNNSGLAVGVCRVIFGDSDFHCKIGRIAVLKEYRGLGVGRLLMNTAIDFAKSRGVSEIVVDSQLAAMGFYAELGFVPFGGVHPDQHVMHKHMRLNIK